MTNSKNKMASQAHLVFNKMRNNSSAEKLAAVQAIGIDPKVAKSHLFSWQRDCAQAALGNNTNPSREDLQDAAAVALGIKPSVSRQAAS